MKESSHENSVAVQGKTQRLSVLLYYSTAVILGSLAAMLYFVGISVKAIAITGALGYGLLNYSVAVDAIRRFVKIMSKDVHFKVGCVVLFISILLWRTRSARDLVQNPVDVASFTRIAQVSAVCLLAVIMLRAKAIFHLLLGLQGAMLVYCVFGLLSALYSSFPLYSAYKAFETTTGVLLVASILGTCNSFRDIQDFVQLMLILFGLLVLTVWVGALLSPRVAFKPSRGLLGYVLQGVFPILNPNAVGFAGSLLGLVAFCHLLWVETLHDKIFYRNILSLALATMVLAQARTSLTGFVVAIAIVLVLNKRMKWLSCIALLVTLILVSHILSAYVMDYFKRGESEELIATMTGRTVAWAHAWKMFKEAPILGYGFASGARFDVLRGSGMVGMHGSLFDVLVNLGLLGLIPWLIAVVGTWLQLLRVFIRYSRIMTHEVKMFHTTVIGIMALLSFRAFTGTSIVMHDKEFLLFLFILGYAQLSALSNGFALEDRLR